MYSLRNLNGGVKVGELFSRGKRGDLDIGVRTSAGGAPRWGKSTKTVIIVRKRMDVPRGAKCHPGKKGGYTAV